MDKVFPALLVSFIVGGVGVFGAFMVYGSRIDALEARAFRIDERITRLESTINDVAVDTAFIRGKMENGK